MLLSLQIDFSFVRPAMTAAGLELSTVITASNYLTLVTVSNFSPLPGYQIIMADLKIALII